MHITSKDALINFLADVDHRTVHDAPWSGVISEPQSNGKHFHERLLAIPARAHARRRARRAKTEEERRFWLVAASDEALLSRHLMVHGRKQQPGAAKSR